MRRLPANGASLTRLVTDRLVDRSAQLSGERVRMERILMELGGGTRGALNEQQRLPHPGSCRAGP